MKNIVAYYRVSTKRQGRSGLGLEAQEKAVQDYQRENGGRVLAAYKEIETGKKSAAGRPELARALAHAKRSGALLVVAKLDRLARNVAFTSALMDAGVDFVACDQPHANRLTIHILAAVAEHEARMISDRTRAALAAYKRRGGLLGGSRPECRNLTAKARAKGRANASKVISEKARQSYADLLPTMQEWRAAGLSQQAIADRLNEQEQTTRRGKPWSQVQVMRVLALPD
jgi:DNA invertase Pin-like site-specific DNA recombinase